MTALRIFSYLPNPRIMKATIAARLCGIDVEIRGDKPKNLADWLWDFEAHKLSDNDRQRVDVIAKPSHTGFNKTLYKTNFVSAHRSEPPWGRPSRARAWREGSLFATLIRRACKTYVATDGGWAGGLTATYLVCPRSSW